MEKTRTIRPNLFTLIASCALSLLLFTLTACEPLGAGGANTSSTGGSSATGGDTSQQAAGSGKPASAAAAVTAAPIADTDLVIPTSEVSSVAHFYPVTVDGTQLEVLVVKAPDGTVRTAYNTCQVCYDSGAGYYLQQGNELVCQNCGNHFKMNEVEVAVGGCNPVPIFAEDKVVSDATITIPLASLQKARGIFANWK
ncbi:MAG: DUF2318 domain-containing protein [Coriobacteriales bacterium]|nr:DUF2318 domain-containing protein [Coriobacteriales bacterium]